MIVKGDNMPIHYLDGSTQEVFIRGDLIKHESLGVGNVIVGTRGYYGFVYAEFENKRYWIPEGKIELLCRWLDRVFNKV